MMSSSYLFNTQSEKNAEVMLSVVVGCGGKKNCSPIREDAK